ncbi:bis(5'-nucleosyl)-tetraphosphatase (symmetrical) YqeK [Candidatus Sumerlaeota bacterium]|nr:bis(5'-nucleosyl)-tetraphosphatase (symmetrical) YqeK [Candidatus Sumerlaeota bacterium]
MVDSTLQRLSDLAHRQLEPKRFLHVLGVTHTAAALAARHGVDPAAAAAALLHDLSKPMSPEAIEADMKARGLSIPEEERNHPKIWHGVHAAALARADYREWLGESAEEIAEAVAVHSTADAGISPLAKILFLADALEPSREFEGIDEFRKMSRSDLDGAFAAVLGQKCRHIADRGGQLSPRAARAVQHYCERSQ